MLRLLLLFGFAEWSLSHAFKGALAYRPGAQALHLAPTKYFPVGHGARVGARVGASVGVLVGAFVGAGVGTFVGSTAHFASPLSKVVDPNAQLLQLLDN